MLPTREDIWGLVINEAMAYGLPIIPTDKCVAGMEMIRKNGRILSVDCNWGKEIQSMLADCSLESMAWESIQIARKYSMENMAYKVFEVLNFMNGSRTGK